MNNHIFVAYQINNGTSEEVGTYSLDVTWSINLRTNLIVSQQLTKVYMKYKDPSNNMTVHKLLTVNFDSKYIR